MTYEEALRYYEETAVYGSRLGLDLSLIHI